MNIEKAPLNIAQQLERRAEALENKKKFNDSIKCHVEAAEFYGKCSSSDKIAQECIKLQKEWNEKQVKLIEMKRINLARRERERKLKEQYMKYSKDRVDNIEEKIFKNFESHDSLICYLSHKDGDEESLQHEVEEDKNQSLYVTGSKYPKHDSMVIEELKELSGQLKESVQGLLVQLDDRNNTIEQLKLQIQQLEIGKTDIDTE